MQRPLASIVLICLSFCAAGAALAAPPRIVVLPFVTSDEELVIYGKPVADAVARGLKGVGETVVGAGDAGKARPDLVVELRVSRVRGKVRVEGLVRDAEVGQQTAHASAKAVPLSDLDQAAAELARALVRPIGDAIAVRAQRQSDEKAAVKALPAQAPAPAATDLRKPDLRPAILVLQPEGTVAGGAVEFRDVAIGATARLFDGLGYRTVLGARRGFVSPTDAAREASAARARATVMMELHDVEFEWSGVLLARGRLHLVVVGVDARVLFDRDVATDTLVGSRADSHDALVRFVVAQALDISRRELAGALQGY